MLLAGKTIVVTGAGAPRGIGRALCRIALAQGASVIATDIVAPSADSFCVTANGKLRTLGADITDEADCTGLAQLAQDVGGCDSLVHCAGIAAPLALAELTRTEYDRMLDVNLWGTLQLAKAVVPQMIGRGSGSIVLLSSLAAQRGGGFVGGLHYTASKAAVLGVMKSLARELGVHNIRVNAVSPGLVDTDMTAPYVAADQRAGMAKQALLGRMATADEIANACLYLASELSTYVTGATLDVNGGLHIH